MNCDQIIYLGIFAIVAIYLYQNVLTPQYETFVPYSNGNGNGNIPRNGNSNGNRNIPSNGNRNGNRNIPSNANRNAVVNANRASVANNAASVKLDSPGNQIRASEPIGNNEMNLPVQFNRTPSQCYPQNTLTASDLLPEDESKEISEFNQNYPIGQGITKGINFLSSGYHIGVNTVGQSLKNANRQLRSEPPNPQVSVSPWMNSSIAPDLLRRPLEVGDSCGKGNGI